MQKLTTVIMTFNEAMKIEQCIQSVLPISDEIIVLDSFSTDDTTTIAKSLGAQVYEHTFMGYIKQRELSINLATNDLVLALDADEYLSPELQEEINTIKENPNHDAYYINRLNAINHYWLKHGSWFPHRIIRLFDRSKISCQGNPPHDLIVPNKNASTTKFERIINASLQRRHS